MFRFIDGGQKRIVFRREDGQRMALLEGDKLISYNSAFPITGFYYRVEVFDPDSDSSIERAVA